jgi:hypothetical protein
VQLYDGRSRPVLVKEMVLGGSFRTLTAVSSALFMELSVVDGAQDEGHTSR